MLAHEDSTLSGKVTPDPTKNDSSAVSRFGVNSASHPEAVKEGFFEMSRDAALQYAEDIFKFDYFNMVGGSNIAEQDICNKLCDLAFNMGVHQACEVMQQALADVEDWDPAVVIDGICGSRTVALINATPSDKLMDSVKQRAREFYMALAADHPSMKPNLQGWLNRVDA